MARFQVIITVRGGRSWPDVRASDDFVYFCVSGGELYNLLC